MFLVLDLTVCRVGLYMRKSALRQLWICFYSCLPKYTDPYGLYNVLLFPHSQQRVSYHSEIQVAQSLPCIACVNIYTGLPISIADSYFSEVILPALGCLPWLLMNALLMLLSSQLLLSSYEHYLHLQTIIIAKNWYCLKSHYRGLL